MLSKANDNNSLIHFIYSSSELHSRVEIWERIIMHIVDSRRFVDRSPCQRQYLIHTRMSVDMLHS